MSPLAAEIDWWHTEFLRFRRKVYLLITVGFFLILSGFVVIAVSYVTGQHDVHRVSCANSQALIEQFEFAKRLAVANQTGALTPEQIQQRARFYAQAERLALERAGDTCATLQQMQAQARIDIDRIIGGTP